MPNRKYFSLSSQTAFVKGNGQLSVVICVIHMIFVTLRVFVMAPDIYVTVEGIFSLEGQFNRFRAADHLRIF